MNVIATPATAPAADTTIECGMCGHRFDPQGHAACAGCPLNDACLMACCPSCGYSMPNPARSRLLALGRAIAKSLRSRRVAAAPHEDPSALSRVKPGSVVRVVEIGEGASGWHERLQAYGIAPGREVTVVQQAPVTVVRVDHVDLAFEAAIARHIIVE
ncbi:MAG: FeoA family protein [Vicinamibacterales bacterium]|nr:FeoA family protein [Vicinamibacterales bacterium]